MQLFVIIFFYMKPYFCLMVKRLSKKKPETFESIRTYLKNSYTTWGYSDVFNV